MGHPNLGCGSGFLRSAAGGATPGGPAFFGDLLRAAESERIRRDGMGDAGARADVCAVADGDGCDEG